MRKCHAMPGIRAKGAPVMMSRCAPQKKWKTLSMSSAARPESAVMKYEENCLQNEQMNFESNLWGKQKFYYYFYFESLSKKIKTNYIYSFSFYSCLY